MPENAPATKVVIVDDSPIIASRLSQLLGGYALIEISGVATNIPSALDIIELHKPDVVILDIFLKEDAPTSSGITLLGTLRQLYPQMQIIMLTNLSGEAYYNKCMELGANFFLDKSSDFEKIPDLLSQIHQMANTPWPWIKETKGQ